MIKKFLKRNLTVHSSFWLNLNNKKIIEPSKGIKHQDVKDSKYQIENKENNKPYRSGNFEKEFNALGKKQPKKRSPSKKLHRQ